MIKINNVHKSFNGVEVLKDITLEIKKGEVFGLVGHSGAGKSTLLRCINLLEKPSGGEIIYNGENILDDNHDIYKYRTKFKSSGDNKFK